MTSRQANGSTYTWDIVKNISVELTTKGDEYLKDNSRQDVEFELNKRLLESHELSQQVSQSVIDTNKKMVSISIDQANTNKAIADNSTTQTNILEGQADILKKQMWIFFATAIFALLACIIAGISLGLEIRKDQSEKQLQQQTKEIKELRTRIKILMTDTSVMSAAKKTSPKKN
jgi:hypothetical protein